MQRQSFLGAIVTLLAITITCFAAQARPVDTKYLSNVPQYVLHESAPGAFRLAADGSAASILVSGKDWQGVVRAANDLGQDIGRVTGTAAQVVTADAPRRGSIIVGTIGKSPLIDGLVKAGRLNVDGVRGQWESFVIETLYNREYWDAAGVEDGVAHDKGDVKKDTRGYVKFHNGIPVVTSQKSEAEVFNLEVLENIIPTANETIADEAEGVEVIAGNGAVTIQGAAGKTVVITNILGKAVANTTLTSDNQTINVPAGIVVVTVDGEAVKAIVK